MNYYEYLDLPHPSADLIQQALEAQRNTSQFHDPNHTTYQFYNIGRVLKEFTNSIFDFPHSVALQVISEGIPVHIDMDRSVAYNYIIDTGGENVLTAYYNIDNFIQHKIKYVKLFPKPDEPPAAPIFTVCFEPFRWHRLDVSTPHNVINLKHKRLAITVSPC